MFELCSMPALRDQWVALDLAGQSVRSETSALPNCVTLRSGAIVVDADEDLDVLCRRIDAARRTSLTILFAGRH